MIQILKINKFEMISLLYFFSLFLEVLNGFVNYYSLVSSQNQWSLTRLITTCYYVILKNW